MSPKARIGYRHPGESFIYSAYHHEDGSPERLGATLKERFNTLVEVRNLVAGGPMLCCWTCEDWNMSQKEWGPLYFSSRDGVNLTPYYSEDLETFLEFSKGVDFAYLFQLEGWKCYNPENGEEIAL